MSSSSAWYCPVCKKPFRSLQCFLKHHTHKSRIQCKVFYNRNPSTLPTQWYDPVTGPSLNVLTANITGYNPPNNPPIQRNQHAQEEEDDASTQNPPLDTLNDNISMEEDGPVQGDDASSMEDASVDSSQRSVDSAYNPNAPAHRETLEQFTRHKHGGDGACPRASSSRIQGCN